MMRSSFFILFALLFCTALSFAASGAVLEKVEGEVVVIRRLKKLPATAGFELQRKDIVKTGVKSLARIVFSSGDKVDVAANSRLKLAKLMPAGQKRQTSLEILSGTGAFNVNPLSAEESFEVKTPVAVAGVRGTSFVVSHVQFGRKFRTTLTVVEGKVRVASIRFAKIPSVRPVTCGALETSSVPDSAPPSPAIKISPQKLDQILQEVGLDADSVNSETASTEAPTQKSESRAQLRQEIQSAISEQMSSIRDRIREQTLDIIQERIATEIQGRKITRPIAPPTTPSR